MFEVVDDLFDIFEFSAFFDVGDEVDFFVEAVDGVLGDEVDAEEHIEDEEDCTGDEDGGEGKDFVAPEVGETEFEAKFQEVEEIWFFVHEEGLETF